MKRLVTTFRWLKQMPLGVPVVPEVYITEARSPMRAESARRSSSSAGTSSARRHAVQRAQAGAGGEAGSSTTTWARSGRPSRRACTLRSCSPPETSTVRARQWPSMKPHVGLRGGGRHHHVGDPRRETGEVRERGLDPVLRRGSPPCPVRRRRPSPAGLGPGPPPAPPSAARRACGSRCGRGSRRAGARRTRRRAAGRAAPPCSASAPRAPGCGRVQPARSSATRRVCRPAAGGDRAGPRPRAGPEAAAARPGWQVLEEALRQLRHPGQRQLRQERVFRGSASSAESASTSVMQRYRIAPPDRGLDSVTGTGRREVEGGDGRRLEGLDAVHRPVSPKGTRVALAIR